MCIRDRHKVGPSGPAALTVERADNAPFVPLRKAAPAQSREAEKMCIRDRFAIEAASEMATLSDSLGWLGTSERISEHLSMTAHLERLHRTNTWKAALYEALSQSAWYQGGGYQRPVV